MYIKACPLKQTNTYQAFPTVFNKNELRKSVGWLWIKPGGHRRMARAGEKCYTPPVARTCNRMRLSPGPPAVQRYNFLWN